MSGLDDSAERRTNISSNTPLLSARQWEQMRDSFNRAGKAMEVGSIVAAGMAARAPDLRLAAGYSGVAVAAQGSAFAAKEAADFCNTQAIEAQKVEDARIAQSRAEAARQAEQARIDNERARAAAERDRRFQQALARSQREHRDRVESGRFMREYRDPPTPRQLDRASRTA